LKIKRNKINNTGKEPYWEPIRREQACTRKHENSVCCRQWWSRCSITIKPRLGRHHDNDIGTLWSEAKARKFTDSPNRPNTERLKLKLYSIHTR